VTSIAKITGVVNAFFDCVGILFSKIRKINNKNGKVFEKRGKK
jgi:hypothetical protein